MSGQPQQKQTKIQTDNITLVPHLSTRELAAAFSRSKENNFALGLFNHHGLEALKCLQEAEFIPTPGRTEQNIYFQFIEIKKWREIFHKISLPLQI